MPVPEFDHVVTREATILKPVPDQIAENDWVHVWQPRVPRCPMEYDVSLIHDPGITWCRIAEARSEQRRRRWSILIRHQNMAVVRLLLSGWNACRSRGVTWKPKRFEQSATTVVGLGIEVCSRSGMKSSHCAIYL
jgi:hypothetical protein